MSQYPPPGSVNPNFDPSLPPGGKAKTSGMALAAMIVGIASVPLLVACGLGALSGIVALILGIIALVSINKNPVQYGGKGMAIAGIITGALAVVLAPALIAVFLPALGMSRELSNRSVCAANLRGIMQSMVVYSADNAEYYPYLGGKTIAAKPAIEPTPGGLMNDVFVLVTDGQVGAQQFLCKSDPAKTAASGVSTPYWSNPTGGDPNLCYSYSFAFQYASPNTLGAWWRNTVDAGVAIAADMNPGTQAAGKPNCNSLNHRGDGQNIGFGDAHTEFVRTPTCGENNDHIYNIGPNQPPSAPGIGGMPFPAGNNQGNFDTCLEPIITNTTSYTRG